MQVLNCASPDPRPGRTDLRSIFCQQILVVARHGRGPVVLRWVGQVLAPPVGHVPSGPARYGQLVQLHKGQVLERVPDPRPAKPATPINPVGIDRNVGQVALSTGAMYELPKLLKLDAKLRRLQRKLSKQQYKSNGWHKTKLPIQKIYREIAHVIKNWCHQTSRTIADIHDLVIFEDLNIQGMTRSARGSKEKPGKNVAQKRGLNRAVLRSGWGPLERYMSYKTYTEKINPAYTSQKCHNCGVIRKANRESQSVYHCQECGVEKNADVNAALNIRDKWLAKNMAFGDGATAGGGGSISWPVKPENVSVKHYDLWAWCEYVYSPLRIVCWWVPAADPDWCNSGPASQLSRRAQALQGRPGALLLMAKGCLSSCTSSPWLSAIRFNAGFSHCPGNGHCVQAMAAAMGRRSPVPLDQDINSLRWHTGCRTEVAAFSQAQESACAIQLPGEPGLEA